MSLDTSKENDWEISLKLDKGDTTSNVEKLQESACSKSDDKLFDSDDSDMKLID